MGITFPLALEEYLIQEPRVHRSLGSAAAGGTEWLLTGGASIDRQVSGLKSKLFSAL